MTLRLNLSPEAEARLQATANAAGISVEEYASELLERTSKTVTPRKTLRSKGIAAHLPVRSSHITEERRAEVERELKEAA